MPTVNKAQTTDLPVQQIIPQVREHLQQHQNLMLSAAPGAGKSTLLPLTLLDEPWLQGKKTLLLEPRRLAAASIAKRMASLLGEEVGQTVGYRIRFDTRISSQTRIEVVTEGILTRMLQQDNALEDYGLVIFDEFHERSIHADTALAFCLESQQILRPDLKLLLMSATLDGLALTERLDSAWITCPGRQHPIETMYTGSMPDLNTLPDLCLQTISSALREQEGDILVFLPGQAEIKHCQSRLNTQYKQLVVHALYGQMSLAEQQAAILPDSQGKRKIVLATSLAETSLTIEGIKVVIDSGFTRKAVYDPKIALSGLQTTLISLDVADQRRGRAGRLGPGVCYRMWSMATEMRMLPHRIPEMMEADLMPLALDLAQWGVDNAQQLIWLDPPPADRLDQARESLAQMGALDQGRLTPHGKQMQRLPCHPRLAHMLLAAKREQLALAADLAALLEEKDPLSSLQETDMTLRVEALRAHRNGIRKNSYLEKSAKASAFYHQLLKLNADNGFVDPYAIGSLLAYAYPERIAGLIHEKTGQFMMANGRKAALPSHDPLADEPFLAIAQVDIRMGMGKIFLAAPLSKTHLLTQAMVQEQVEWNSEKGGLQAWREWKVGNLIIQRQVLQQFPDQLAHQALLNALGKEGFQLLNFNEETVQWQNRVMSLRKWNPEQHWPKVDTPTLLSSIEQWIHPYILGIRKTDELKKINLARALQHHLSYEQQQALVQLAPASIIVPSGSLIPLTYHADGAPPVLAVRLQEVFGLLDTPRINDGKVNVVIHLLSPGFKPVQVTTDLRSFWNDAYFEVRKELKRRYPKHAWPDNPLEAPAVRGAVKKNRNL